MSLTPKEVAKIIERLDLVCREAQELQERLRRAMVTRARDEQQFVSKGSSERRRAPPKSRAAERRGSKRSG
jgi:hypothetical protein